MDYENAIELIVKAAMMDGVETTIRPAKNLGLETAIEINMRRGNCARSKLIDWHDVKTSKNGEERLMYMLKDNLFSILRYPYDI